MWWVTPWNVQLAKRLNFQLNRFYRDPKPHFFHDINSRGKLYKPVGETCRQRKTRINTIEYYKIVKENG